MKRSATILFLIFLTVLAGTAAEKPKLHPLALTPKSDVFMQGFYWDSPPGGIWWDSLARLAPQLASAGFSAIWFPSPVKGAGGGFSMGYDPYDHFDVGEFDQIGGVATRFGTKVQLMNAIDAYHEVGMSVFADAVMNHMNGGEEKTAVDCKPYPAYPDSDWLIFNYPRGSGRFPKNAASFYPNQQTCDVNPPYHGASDPIFQFGVWLAKDKQSVRDSLIVWGQWLKSVIGFDGFRLDAVKSIDPAFMGPWLAGANSGGYAVAEYFGSTGEITGWLNATKSNGGSLAMFDFPLRYTLQDMCNTTSGWFDMRNLDGAGLVNSGVSGYDVSTFVENHDVDRIGYADTVAGSGHNPIISDKQLAYAYIMFSEGRPCVFFRDYFIYGLGRTIDSLIWIRQHYVAGGTTKRSGLNAWGIRQDGNSDQGSVGPDFYVARRDGYGGIKESFMVINDNATQWIDVWVDTDLPVGTVLKDLTGHDANKTVTTPDHPGGKNRVKLWAPKRNYSIYVADTNAVINHPPAMENLPPLMTYTNAAFSYQTVVADADNDVLSYSLTNSPAWLSVSSSGMLSGTPAFADTGSFTVIVNAEDPKGGVASDTTTIQVLFNRRPELSAISDTSVRITKRYEDHAYASDPDGDPLTFAFVQAPGWLNIGVSSGLISGTPGPEDIGSYTVAATANDLKGGLDTVQYTLTVSESYDTVIATYGRPTIDGTVTVSSTDWLAGWKIGTDSAADSKWWADSVTVENELYGLYATWDADSLYIGVDYLCNDDYNTMMLYIDAGLPGGQTNFNSLQGFKGAYPKNNRFRPSDGIEFFAATYYLNNPIMYQTVVDSAANISANVHTVRGAGGQDAEIAVSWNDLYGLGAGLVPPNVELKFVALMAGGLNYGSGDALPDNPDVDGNAGPDSLVNLLTIRPDSSGDGIPDPTVFIDTVYTPITTVTSSITYQAGWNIVSVPHTMDDYVKTSLFPVTASPAYMYDTGYVPQAILENTIGYWLKFNSGQTVQFTGHERLRDTISVNAGWNLVGTFGSAIAASSVIKEPAGVSISDFFTFSNGYQKSLTLQPGRGYWVKVSAPGMLILVKP